MTLFLAMPGSEYVEAVRPFHGHDGSYPFAADKISAIDAGRVRTGFLSRICIHFWNMDSLKDQILSRIAGGPAHKRPDRERHARPWHL